MGIITDREMKAKPGVKDQWLTEDAPKGHGRFTARITAGGDRLFYFRYTAPDGKRVSLPLGRYDPKGRDGLTLADGRTKAGELSKVYQSGVTDIKAHLEAEMRLAELRREAEQAKFEADRKAAEIEKARLASRFTVHDLFDRWAKVDLVRRKDGGKEIRRMFEKDVLPEIGPLAVEEVRKGHITGVTDALLARGVTRMAKLIFSLVRQMFRFAVDRDIIEFDPSASIRKSKIGGKDTERDRVLSEDEIRALVRQLPMSGLSGSAEVAVWLALSTCCRVGELMAARWEHVDLERKTWWIPAEIAKNGKAHTVYLSDFAASYFQVLKDTADEALVDRRIKDPKASPFPWIYPNRTGTGAVCPKSLTKQLGDRQRGNQPPMKGRAKKELSSALELIGGKWGPHDLRRTGATMMVALGIVPEVAERCLNHTEQNRVKRTYQRHSYENEMREAWRLLGGRLELLAGQHAGNVLTLHSKASA